MCFWLLCPYTLLSLHQARVAYHLLFAQGRFSLISRRQIIQFDIRLRSDTLAFMLQKAPPAVHISKQLDPFSLTYLQPPPSMPFEYVPRRHIQLSPLCPPNASVDGRGLERTLFEEMLNASRERSAMLVPKKPVGLRKEIAVKAQKVKAQKVKQREYCAQRYTYVYLLTCFATSPTSGTFPK